MQFAIRRSDYQYTRNDGTVTEQDTYLLHIDVNNLYGHAMCQPLPIGGFELNSNAWTEAEILDLSPDGERGYFFETDLEYPQELHDRHSDLPLAPVQQIPPGAAVRDSKLLLTLDNKSRYIVHYRLLQFYLKQGLKLKKVHKALGFRQEPWIRSYIMGNNECRVKSKTKCDRNFYKFMNNSVYGKTLQNVRKHVDARLVRDSKQLRGWLINQILTAGQFTTKLSL